MKQPFSFFIKSIPLISGLCIEGSGLNKAAQNMGWLLFEQIFWMIIGLTISIWVARYLQPEKFGSLSYVLAFTALFSSIAKIRLDGITVRELVKRPGETDTKLGSGFALAIAYLRLKKLSFGMDKILDSIIKRLREPGKSALYR